DHPNIQPGSNQTGDQIEELEATKENFDKAFKAVAQKAKSVDELVIFLSGHGVSLPGEKPEYGYLTKDARTLDKSALSDSAIKDHTVVTSANLVAWIKQIAATKRALILDTCEAGAIAQDIAQLREGPWDQVKVLDQVKDATGFHVLMGAAINNA